MRTIKDNSELSSLSGWQYKAALKQAKKQSKAARDNKQNKRNLWSV